MARTVGVPFTHKPPLPHTHNHLHKFSPPALHKLLQHHHHFLHNPIPSSSSHRHHLRSGVSWDKKEDPQQLVSVMESPDFSPPHSDPSRPSLGFPLGTALLLIIIFSLSGIFSCCYHWDKLRSLRRSFSDDRDPEADVQESPSKTKPEYTVNLPNLNLNYRQIIDFCLVITCTLLNSLTISSLCGCCSSGFKAEPEPKHASTNAWRSDSKVHSIAMSLRASKSREDRCTGAEATL